MVIKSEGRSMHETSHDNSGRTGKKAAGMSNREFRLFSQFIENACGIRMPDAKQFMLESRLQKRLRHLGISSFREYYDYLTSQRGMRDELISMIDVVTTNKTDFFREAAHFSYLADSVLPRIPEAEKLNGVRVWSAGCSSGEEPYTLAMALNEYARSCQGFRFSVLATDICTDVLESARRGIYEEDKIAPIPHELKKRYLLRSRDRSRGVVRICPELRSTVTFQRLNFMDETFEIGSPLRIIFCRNVIIYFDRQTQEKLLNKFCRYLHPGGYLFLGHSETLNGLDVPLVQVNSTIYRKPA
jgi:chemotaxis protein methyltransferase CheR